MNGLICNGYRSDAELEVLVKQARKTPGGEGQDLTALVSTPTPYVIRAGAAVPRAVEDPFLAVDLIQPVAVEHRSTLTEYSSPGVLRVAVIDYGVKRNILRRLFALGCEVVVLPKHYSAEQILSLV